MFWKEGTLLVKNKSIEPEFNILLKLFFLDRFWAHIDKEKFPTDDQFFLHWNLQFIKTLVLKKTLDIISEECFVSDLLGTSFRTYIIIEFRGPHKTGWCTSAFTVIW